nr:glycosyltransferase family 2 protein [Brevundimonas lenta]
MRETALCRRLSPLQSAAAFVLLVGPPVAMLAAPDATAMTLGLALAFVFLFSAAWKACLVAATLRWRPPAALPARGPLPRYTILAALYDEGPVVGQLVRRLAAIDYPANRLEGFLILEEADAATRAAVARVRLPKWLRVIIAPPGCPQTKPRALNVALEQATGELLTVYDAEDEPDPHQLREAAARFAADAGKRIAALQAPLRIRCRPGGATPLLDQQFAAEYAALFEVALPGATRLGLPFPLGGTSNHFRVEALRAVGGWDSWNVTEDADLGFRLWRHGWTLGVLTRPTWESPPGAFRNWLPQRTRWLKGYMQTWGVHTRRVSGLGWRGGFSLVATLGLGLASAAAHAPSMLWLLGSLIALGFGGDLHGPGLTLSVLILGSATAWLTCLLGARRAGVRYGPVTMMLAPAYWALLTLAWGQAVWRLIREPFFWDKTPHEPDEPAVAVATPALDAHDLVGLSATHAAPEPVA